MKKDIFKRDINVSLLLSGFFIVFTIVFPFTNPAYPQNIDGWNEISIGESIFTDKKGSNFANDDRPVIDSIEPTSGPPGTEVTINGRNFISVVYRPFVRFGHRDARVISIRDTTQIVVEVPPGSGTVKVAVSTYARTSNKVKFTYLKPAIESVSPQYGASKDTITIYGKNFGPRILGLGQMVKFGRSVARIISWTDSEIKVEAPSDLGTGLNQDTLIGLLLALAEEDWKKVTKLIIKWGLKKYLTVIPDTGIKVDVTVATYAGKSNAESFIYVGNPSNPTAWVATYGGDEIDGVASIQQTSDGGYIVAGITNSFGAGESDFLVLKLDASGGIQWQKTYGGDNRDTPTSIQQTADGGYIVAGWTDSFGVGYMDIWVLKLAGNGNVQWQKTYGGSYVDVATSIQQIGGGYIVAGYSYTEFFGASKSDFWVLKLDSSGNIQWQKTYGGGNDEWATSIWQTGGEGYIVAGWTRSFGAGLSDFWVLKLDSGGNVLWQKTYGSGESDHAKPIQQTSDGGYIVAGYTDSFGAGVMDLWVLKLDSSGNVLWQNTYGGSNYDWASSIQQTSDGGYIVAGYTYSFGSGLMDFWVLKLNSRGGVQWQKVYGGGSWDSPWSIHQTVDGGYIVAGTTDSFGAGNADFWVLKLKPEGTIDPSCDFIQDTNVSGVDTNVVPVGTNASPVDTNVTPQPSDAEVNDTDVEANFLCQSQ